MRMSILNTATTEQMGYDIVSFFCVLAPRGMNKIGFGERRGRGQESTACSEDISVMEFYLSAFALHLRGSILFIFWSQNTGTEKESPGSLILYLSKSEKRKKII